MKRFFQGLVFLGALGVFGQPVLADIITFETVQLPQRIDGSGGTLDNPIYDPDYVYPAAYGGELPGFSDGILSTMGFSFSGGHFHLINKPYAQLYGGYPDNGTQYISPEVGGGRGASITLTSDTGRPFSLLGFDAAESFVDVAAAGADPTRHYLVATDVLVTGVTTDGQNLSALFRLDGLNDGGGLNPDFQAFAMPLDWTGLRSVTFTGLDAGAAPAGYSLDNVSVVLGPSVVALLDGRLLVNGTDFGIRGVVYSPAPTGAAPQGTTPPDDFFTSSHAAIHDRDLPLLREMGANTVRIVAWDGAAEHGDFLDKAFNGGVDPVYVIAGYTINGGLDIDPASPGNVRSQIKAGFREMVARHKNHPAILMWAIGSDLNAPAMYGDELASLFSLIDEMAAEAHQEEGATFHPVTTPLLDHDLVGTIADAEALAPSLDLWGVNVFRGNTFGTIFSDLSGVSSKPVVVLEFGVDAFDTRSGDEFESAGNPLQADYAEALWRELQLNAGTCVGGTIMEYSDEWWRGDLSTDAGCTSGGPASHDTCGQPATFQPDSYSNDEWWGIMRAVPNGASADLVEPRAVYHRLQSLWVPPAHASMTINADATYTRSPSVTLTLACLEGHDCANMKFSNDRTNWSAPQPFAQSATWSLSSGDGAKSVFAAVEDSTGGWSRVVGDTIVLDGTPPATAALPAGGTYTTSQTVVLRCSDNTSGCDRTFYTTDGSTPTTASPEYSGPLLIPTATTLRYFSVDRAGTAESARSQTYVIDTVPPTGTIVINGGATQTRNPAVALALSCADDIACSQMQFSTDGATWSSPQSFATTRTYAMGASNGLRTVFVRYRDNAGNWSGAFSDTIVLDTIAPATAAIPGGGIYATPQAVRLSCTDGTGTGCDRTYFTTDGSLPTAMSTLYTAPIPIAASMTLRYLSLDLAGNTETVKTQTYTIDTIPPTGTVSVSGGASFTRSQVVTLSLTCADNIGCSQMQFSNDNVTWSNPQTYASTRLWSLTAGTGLRTVHARYRDGAGNWSDTSSTSIFLDASAPLTTASPAAGTYAGSQIVSLSCSDGSGSGCDRTYYTLDGSAPTTSSAVYAGPLTISATATLRFSSTDGAGNSETARTQTYTIVPD